MKSILFVSLAVSIVILSISCSDSVSPTVESVVRVRADISNNMVQSINSRIKIPSALKTEVDSLKITKVRILLSEIKFHSTSETNENTDKNFNAGPFLYEANIAGNNAIIAEGNLPVGNYNKIKFEIHRFSSSEKTFYSNDITFSEFATDERYAVLIEGFVYKFGTEFPFVYKSSPTVNISLDIVPDVEITNGVSADIYLRLNPINFMKIGNSVLDPRDSTNNDDINYLIQSAIKATKN